MYYYKEIVSLDEVIGEGGIWKQPQYVLDEYILDENRRNGLNRALEAIKNGKNILITGPPGSGKTAFMVYLLKNLMDRGYNTALLLDTAIWITNEHLKKGYILFFDDLLTLDRKMIRLIFRNKIGGLVTTIRTQELGTISRIAYTNLESLFEIIHIEPMSYSYLENMIRRYVFREGIEIVDEEAIDIICRKSNGLPIYIWQVVRELKITKQKLSREYAERIPQGMLNYIDTLLWKILDEHEERYEILLTLIILSDLPRYSVHQDIFNSIYIVAREIKLRRKLGLQEALYCNLLDRITRYLVRYREKYLFGLPHESWVDVLRGKSTGPLSGEISRVNLVYPFQERRRILYRAIDKAYREILPKIKDKERKNTLLENIRTIRTMKIRKPRPYRKPRRDYIISTTNTLRKHLHDPEIPSEICEKAVSIVYATDKYEYLDIASAIIVKYTIQTKDTYYLYGTLRKLTKQKSPKIASNIAIYYYMQGQYREAHELYKNATDYGDIQSHIALALIELMMGHPELAKTKLIKYLKHRKNKDAQKLLQAIETLTK